MSIEVTYSFSLIISAFFSGIVYIESAETLTCLAEVSGKSRGRTLDPGGSPAYSNLQRRPTLVRIQRDAFER